jgi:apolipoprotein N-acyltransferase
MEEETVVRELPLLDTATVYNRFGDVLGTACLGISLVAAIRAWLLARRRSRKA